jgi:hypothetical protein
LECGLGGRKEPSSFQCFFTNVLSLHPTSAAQQRFFVHTQISLCNYALSPLPSANTLSLILRKRRITTISQQHFHNQQVCCDHQFTDRCSERESSTRPCSSPLWLNPQASPTALRAGPCTQQPHSAHLVRSTAPSHIMSPLLDSPPGAKNVDQIK